MTNTKEVKLRLQSINNTKKITKAMELVSASKMRKATEAALQTRYYHSLAWGIVDRLTNSKLWFDSISPSKRFFTESKDVKHTTIVAFTSNRGLCGAFNANIVKLIAPYAEKNGKENISIITVGNKGTLALTSSGLRVEFAHKKDDVAQSDESVIEIADLLYKKFAEKKTDKVLIAYSDYKSAIRQEPVLKQLFPFEKEPQVGIGEDETSHKYEKTIAAPKALEYLYEPNKYDLLEYLIPRIAQVQLYQALLESNASEHSARMLAMKNATDAAKEMANDLLLVFNKARQASITQEIAEISAGRAAVS